MPCFWNMFVPLVPDVVDVVVNATEKLFVCIEDKILGSIFLKGKRNRLYTLKTKHHLKNITSDNNF